MNKAKPLRSMANKPNPAPHVKPTNIPQFKEVVIQLAPKFLTRTASVQAVVLLQLFDQRFHHIRKQ